MTTPTLAALLAVAAAWTPPTADDVPTGVVFEHNVGAYGETVRFVARGPASTAFVTDDALVLHLASPDGDTALRTTFRGARRDARPMSVVAAATSIHHLRGDDPAAWTSAPTSARIAWRELWPGIDVELYDADGHIEYDVIVAPGADPGRARFDHEGADALEIDGDGALLLHTSAGTLRHSPPVLYQDGPDGRTPVAGAFAVGADGSVGFDVGPYDRSRTLVIDPVLGYASYIGGVGRDEIYDVAVLSDGSAVVCGSTTSADLPTTTGVFQPEHASVSWQDAFIAKLVPDGSAFEWITYLGGNDASSPTIIHRDIAQSVAVDGTGHVVVGGRTTCDDFPLVAPFDATNQGENGFLSRLTPDGSALVFSTLLGGPGQVGGGLNQVTAVHAGDDGSIWIAGENHSSAGGIPVTPGAWDTTPVTGGSDAFVMHIDPNGQVIWGTYLGGDDGPNGFPGTTPWDLDVDAFGRVYVAGLTNTLDFPLVGAWDATGPNGTTDILELFGCRISADGSTLEYSTYVGGDDEETVNWIGVACDDGGRMWVAGGTRSNAFPTTPGAFDETFNGGQKDGFVMCVDTDLAGAASVVFSTYLGTPSTDELHDIALAPDGSVCVSGSASGAGFPLIEAWSGHLKAYDVVIAVLDPTGRLTESTYYGSDGADKSDRTAIAVGPDGDLYVVFSANGVGASTPLAAQTSYEGGVYDGVVTRWRRQPISCQTDLGFAGAGNTTMSVCGGDLTGGTLSALRIDTDWGNRPGVLFVGFDVNPTPWPAVGGSLVPVPVLIQVPFVLDSSGDLELLLPGGIGPGHLVFQAVVEQPGTPTGLSLGNAVDVVWP